jgi:hypothetical protein
MLTENNDIQENTEQDRTDHIDHSSANLQYLRKLEDEKEEGEDDKSVVLTDAVIEIKTNLIKPEERKKIGNRLIEDSK